MTWRRIVYPLLPLLGTALVLFVAWRYTEANQSFAVARFEDIGNQFHKLFLFDRFERDVVPTLRRIAIGFSLASIAGVLLGLALGLSRFVRLLTGPLFAFLRAIPPVALVPPFIILIGIEDNMKIILTGFVCLWPVALNTADGILEIDQTMKDTGRAFRFSRVERLRYITLPGAAPRILAGMQISLSFSIIAVIATEYLAGTEGLGFVLNQAQTQFLIPQMWAGILMLGILGYLANVAFGAIRSRVVYWAPSTKAPSGSR